MITAIGSFAANFWRPDIWPSYNDLDLIMSWEEFREFLKLMDLEKKTIPLSKKKFVSSLKGLMIETEIAWPGSSAEDFLNLLEESSPIGQVYFQGINLFIPNMSWLYTFKHSHRYLKNSPYFQKTRKDWLIYRSLGCKIANKKWLKKRERETYVNKLPRLNQSKENFFSGDAIEYVYDHDTLHDAVAHLDRPAYLYYKKDGEEVLCSKKKWKECSKEIKLYGVLEECYVLALERSQIPFPDTDPKESFLIALEKVCTSITSGWFRAWAYEHYDDVLSAYDSSYLDKFKKALEEGKIKKFKG